jgi:predicted Zn-dependent peptidase
VAGAVSKKQLDALVAQHLGEWRDQPAEQPPKGEAAANRRQGRLVEPASKRPKLVFVERLGAPQSVVITVGRGVRADDPDAALLDLVNTALGGSFTSRLNQNLREERGWTYGAGSAFSETRGVGAFITRSSVFSKVTGQAIEQILLELAKMRDQGLTEDELSKVRARDLTDMIQTHETVQGLVGRLASLSELGMPPDADATASRARQQATRAQLDALAKRYLDSEHMTVIVVGPPEAAAQLDALGLGKAEPWSAEGRPIAKD